MLTTLPTLYTLGKPLLKTLHGTGIQRISTIYSAKATINRKNNLVKGEILTAATGDECREDEEEEGRS